MSLTAHLLYGLAWICYGAVHSLLAHPVAKTRLQPLLGGAYRLAYNVFAIVTLGVVWVFGTMLFPAPASLGLPLCASLSLYAVSAASAVGLVMAAKRYDLGRFSGTSQLKEQGRADFAEDEPLITQGLHSHVRHPIYAFAFPLIWGLAQDERGIATAIWISLYLIIGAKLEERRLTDLYGDAYLEYKQKVPAFLPRWRGHKQA